MQPVERFSGDETAERAGVARLMPLFFTLVAMLGTHPYQYGLGNTTITIPFVKAFADASLFPGDALVAERFHLQTILWPLCGAIVRYFTIDVRIVFLIGYALATYFTFVALDRLARALFHDGRVGAIAACFLLLRRPSLGGGVLMESFFDTVVVAQPLVLFAFARFFERRPKEAFFWLGVAFSVHGLTAAHAAFALFAASCALLRNGEGRPIPAALRLLFTSLWPFVLAASPVVLWRFFHAPPDLHLFAADTDWLRTLAIRSPHHVFPTTWSGLDFASEGAAFLVLVFCSTRSPAGEMQRAVVGCVIGVFLLFVAGYVFAEVKPLAVVVQFQLFRASTILRLFEALYLAAALRSAVMERRPKAVIAACAGAVVLFAFGDLWRAASAVFFVIGVIAAGLMSRAVRVPRAFEFDLAAVAFAAAIGCIGALRAGFQFPIEPPREWQAVQEQARAQTEPSACFVVPPDLALADFRIGAERTIYANWKDGTQAFFDPAFSVEWRRRMRRLAQVDDDSRFVLENEVMVAYAHLDAPALVAIANEPWSGDSPVYAIRRRADAAIDLPLAYASANYLVYRVRP